jgi:hypothetical protein
MYTVLAVIFSLGTLLSDTSSLWAQGRDIQPGYLGVTADESALGRGAEVMRVVDGSPANKVGIQPGDIILAIDEHIVNDLKAMVTEMRERPAGRSVKIDFLRKNRLHRVEVTLGVRPGPAPLSGQPMPPTRDLISQLIGLELVTLKSTNRNPGGVMVVDVLFDATGAGPRIPIDAIIHKLDRVAVKTKEDCERVLTRHRPGDRVQVQFVLGNLVQETAVTVRNPTVLPPRAADGGNGVLERQLGEGGRRPILGRLGRVLDGALNDALPRPVPPAQPVEAVPPPNELPLPLVQQPANENSTAQLTNEVRTLRILVEALLDRVEQLEKKDSSAAKKIVPTKLTE